MNANAFHNILNVVFLIVGVLVTFDWTVFGLDPVMTTKIVGALMLLQNVLKLAVNIGRDGVTGLVMAQPPVEK
jgi:hypothetical protein